MSKASPFPANVHRHTDERAERLARLDVSTLSAVELELVEIYRAAVPKVRAAMLTIMRGTQASEKGGT